MAIELEQLQRLAELMNLRFVVPIGRGGNADVFKAEASRGPVAVKCIPAASSRRSLQEQRLAKWAGEVGLGPQVHATQSFSAHACIVMAFAPMDLRSVMARAEAYPFAALRRLWAQAFGLAASRHLRKKKLICSDLKPANLLVFSDEETAPACRLANRLSSSLADAEVRLNDYDPAFWGRVSTAVSASCFNVLTLLSNSLFLGADSRASPLAFFPEAALAVARHALARDERVLAGFREREELCRRGAFRYAQARDLEDYLGRLDAALGSAGDARPLEEALRQLGVSLRAPVPKLRSPAG